MKLRRFDHVVLMIACLVVSGLVAQTETAQKPVLRAKRPSFQKKDWDGVFFENLFAEGLVGQRPQDLLSASAGASSPGADPGAQPSTASAAGWSRLASATVIEDEVKRLQQRLSREVTTPAKFKTEHSQVRQTLSMLSMLFGVISQYDQQIRWSESAHAAQDAFGQAAANARSGSPQAFANAKRCVDDLTALIRGETLSGAAPVDPITDWSSVVDRTSLMRRLDLAFGERLKPMSSSVNDIKANQEDILHEAELIALIGQMLTQQEMLDADDEDYAAYSRAMMTLGQELAAALRSGAQDIVSEKVSLLGQSCDNCHADWR